MKKFTVTRAVAEWVVYTYSIEAEDEAAAREAANKPGGLPTEALVKDPMPVDEIDGYEYEVTVEERRDRCPECSGWGQVQDPDGTIFPHTCYACGGTGEVSCPAGGQAEEEQA